ncbi:MAG: SGNH/GDSL hydrolase family protein [Sedimenticola sp.]
MDTNSSSNASTILLRGESLSDGPNDQFEGVLYRTSHDDKVTELTFVSNVFFQDFLSKMMADFASSMETQETTCTLKVITHIRGLRAEIQMNSDTRTVRVTGEGHAVWREWKFTEIAKSLFRQFVENADSNGQVETFDDESQHIPFIQENVSTLACTSTPRQNLIPQDDILQKLVRKIDMLENEISGLKSTLTLFMERVPTKSYADVASSKTKRTKATESPTLAKRQEVINISDNTCDLSPDVQRGTTEAPRNQRSCQLGVNQVASDNGIPVVISKRPEIDLSLSSIDLTQDGKQYEVREREENRPRTPAAPQVSDKTLLIGDSILGGINENGLNKGIHKRSVGGATVRSIISEISNYELTAFQNVIIHCGGNDASNGGDTELFEEHYDQLLSLIKCRNPANKVFLCKVAPRGDVDVSPVNDSINRLALHWKTQNVHCIHETYDLFYGKDGVPEARFFNRDSIHLSRGGTRRLLGSIHKHMDIVRDYDRCVFGPRPPTGGNTRGASSGSQDGRGWRAVNPRQSGRPAPWNAGRATGPNQAASSNYGRAKQFRCFYCDMEGHKVADCWNR